ncbi:MAG: S-methyl-5'-thioadenosine phosphorylase [Candidatus Omnitrophota bacterium]
MIIGIIGGSGLYKIDGLGKIKKIKVTTPFGKPSSEFICGQLNGIDVVFLPRHGINHTILPSEINYRANIFAMKKIGVEKIISISAVGSLKEELRPLDLVLPDQFFDRTSKRISTFFGKGIVSHVSFADPICQDNAKKIYEIVKKMDIPIHLGGVYVNMEGPQFSTKAESSIYRKLGFDIIAMTNLAEAKLAREAEICYVTLACVTDYDCWHPKHDTVTIDMIISNLNKNVENAKNIITNIVPVLAKERNCLCSSALKYAIVTPKSAITSAVKKRLKPIIGKYI